MHKPHAQPTLPATPARPVAQHTQPARAVHTRPHQRPVQQHVAAPAPSRADPTAVHRYQPPSLPARRAANPRRKSQRPLIALMLIFAAGFVFACGGLSLGALLIYQGGILPGVRAGGVALGGLSEAEAAQTLQTAWAAITLIDPQTERAWRVDPAQIGITLDAARTAERAYGVGRGGEGGTLFSALGDMTIAPVLNIDLTTTQTGLEALLGEIETPAVNAGVRLVNGVVEAAPPQNGRRVDVALTLAQVERDAAGLLADGQLELVMADTSPTITDSTGMVQAAATLLTSPLVVRLYDPVTGDLVNWSAPPETWAGWLTAVSAPDSPTGLTLSIADAPLRAFLTDNAMRGLDASRYLDIDKAVSAVQTAITQNRTTAAVRVYHHDRPHVVAPGETIISIAWDYGVPYPWVQRANNGISQVSSGQTITIPSPDNFLTIEPNPDKRIEVSISQQRVYVYENGGLKWEWVASTGIADSPTWTGIYQIISHVPNAYAANWDLWMPNFMGVYQPIPGADFTNGFHGFPTRGGGQLLWENSLGTRVTYGCILLSNTNIGLLYDWAEPGVVVEIMP